MSQLPSHFRLLTLGCIKSQALLTAKVTEIIRRDCKGFIF